MITMKIDNANLQAALKDMKRYNKAVRDKVGKEIISSAYKIQSQAFKNAPKKTTFLAHSIAVLLQVLGAEVQAHADYSVYVHEGTSKMKGRPFLGDAADEELPKLYNKILTITKGG